jgi:hypothetical protein
MSAIDFVMEIERMPNPKGDLVKIAMSRKFLPYKYYGSEQGIQEYGVTSSNTLHVRYVPQADIWHSQIQPGSAWELPNMPSPRLAFLDRPHDVLGRHAVAEVGIDEPSLDAPIPAHHEG